MANGSQSRGGGVLIAGAALAGAITGLAVGQPSIGLIAGTAVGVLAALLLWLRDRRA